MSSPEIEAAGRRVRSQLDAQRDGEIREEESALCSLRIVSTLLAWLRARHSPGVTRRHSPHQRWPLFPQKAVQRSRASLAGHFGSLAWSLFLAFLCVVDAARGLSLSGMWVVRPELCLVSMLRRHDSTEPVGPGSGTEFCPPSLELTVELCDHTAEAHWAAERKAECD